MSREATRPVLWIVLGLVLSASAVRAQEAVVHYYNADWFPDGETIVFESDRDGKLALYSVRADGRDLRRLTPEGIVAEVPRVSPDGGKITYVTRVEGGPLQLQVMNRDGSGARRVATSDRADYSASWSPDGARLVFMSRPAGATVTHDLHVVGLEGSGRAAVTGDDGNDLGPDWSPRGDWIVFVRGAAFHKDYRELTPEERATMTRSRDVWIVRPDGSDLTALTEDDVADCCAHWSPDGTEVYYRHGEGEEAVVLGVRPGGEPRRIAGPEVAEPNPSPDGRRFVYTREKDGAFGVFVYDRESGEERRIVP